MDILFYKAEKMINLQIFSLNFDSIIATNASKIDKISEILSIFKL